MFIVRRLIHSIPVVLIVAVGVFLILEAAPGDAVDKYLADTGGGDLALAEQLRKQWGLDASVAVQFLAYMKSVVTLDLGRSVTVGAPVTEAILNRLPTTLLLMGSAGTMSAVLGGLLGAVAAMRRGRPLDSLLTASALTLNAIPGFWLGLIFIVVFVVWLGWFPNAGRRPSMAHRIRLAMPWTWRGTWSCRSARWGSTYMALYLRLMRGAMTETRASPWVRAARARGLPSDRDSSGGMSPGPRCCPWSPCSDSRSAPCSAAAWSSRPCSPSRGWAASPTWRWLTATCR